MTPVTGHPECSGLKRQCLVLSQFGASRSPSGCRRGLLLRRPRGVGSLPLSCLGCTAHLRLPVRTTTPRVCLRSPASLLL